MLVWLTSNVPETRWPVFFFTSWRVFVKGINMISYLSRQKSDIYYENVIAGMKVQLATLFLTIIEVTGFFLKTFTHTLVTF